jgi:uncharacterized protein (DUF1697 family)
VRRFVALLRGVNVGTSRRVPMGALRTTLSASGLHDVRTYLQSGNVVFSAEERSAPKLTRTIESSIEREFGLRVDTLVLACDIFARIAAENPFLQLAPTPDESSLHVAFMFETLAPEAFAARELPAGEGECALLGDQAIYLLLPHGVGRSKLAAGLTRVGVPTTSRNWRTVTTLVGMCEAAPS